MERLRGKNESEVRSLFCHSLPAGLQEAVGSGCVPLAKAQLLGSPLCPALESAPALPLVPGAEGGDSSASPGRLPTSCPHLGNGPSLTLFHHSV